MHRIDGPGATASGLFTEGNPAQGVPATTVTGAWLNAIQEEIAGVVTGAGMDLEKADNAQLLAAVRRLIDVGQNLTTGDVKLTIKAVPDAGWVMCNDGTIGGEGSGATTYAGGECRDLFMLLWNNVADGFAPVSGGRGGSAQIDWDGGKTIQLTRMLGRALAVAGGGTDLSPRALGQFTGSESVTLTEAQMPGHTHQVTDPGHAHQVTDPGHAHGVTDPGHTHSYSRVTVADGAGSQDGNANSHVTSTTGSSKTGITINSSQAGLSVDSAQSGVSVGSAGAGEPHSSMQPTVFLNAMIKL